MSDFFQNLISRELTTKACADCGREFQTAIDEACCFECQYYRNHPLEKTMVWTWAKVGSEWGAAAYWPDRAPYPEVGDSITVNRKDGATSVATIREIEGLRYQRDGQGRLYCYITKQ